MKGKKTKPRGPRGRAEDWMYPDIDVPLSEDGKVTRYKLFAERYEVIVQWARNGLTKQEIAKEMRISTSTLNTWEKKCPDIVEALKEARAYAHARVENALFKKAVGFRIKRQQPVKKKVQDYDGVGKKIGEHEEIELIEIEEEVPPDMGAIAFYLKNNMPQKYRDKWPEKLDEAEETEAENMCLRDFTKAVAKAVIKEQDGR